MTIASGYAYDANEEPVNVVELLKSSSSKGAVVYTDRFTGSKTHNMPTACTGLMISNDGQSDMTVTINLEENELGLSIITFAVLVGEGKQSTYFPFKSVDIVTDSSYRIEGAL